MAMPLTPPPKREGNQIEFQFIDFQYLDEIEFNL